MTYTNSPYRTDHGRSTSTYHPYSRFEQNTTNRFTLKEPYLTQILKGDKTVEGRINSGAFRSLKEGDNITFYNHTGKEAKCIIKTKRVYRSFYNMLDAEGVSKCLPGVESRTKGAEIYESIPSYRQRAERNGVVALRLELKTEKKTPSFFRFTLKEPYLTQIIKGKKTVEGRINSGAFKSLKEGDHITFYNHTGKEAKCIIKTKRVYRSFYSMLDAEGVSKCLPGVESRTKGAEIYESIPSYRQRAERDGVVALRLELIPLEIDKKLSDLPKFPQFPKK